MSPHNRTQSPHRPARAARRDPLDDEMACPAERDDPFQWDSDWELADPRPPVEDDLHCAAPRSSPRRRLGARRMRHSDPAVFWLDFPPCEPVVNAPNAPVQLLSNLLATWRLNQAQAAPLLGFDPSDAAHVSSVLAGREPLRGRDAKERLARLIWMRAALSEWLRDDAAENAWLRAPHDALRGQAPMTLLLNGGWDDALLVHEWVQTAIGW